MGWLGIKGLSKLYRRKSRIKANHDDLRQFCELTAFSLGKFETRIVTLKLNCDIEIEMGSWNWNVKMDMNLVKKEKNDSIAYTSLFIAKID